MFLEREEPGIDEDAVCSALANACDRRILALAQQRPVAAKTILERTGIPKSTLYRRIDRLQEHGLLEVVSSTIEDGHRIDRYRCTLSRLAVRVEGGEVHLDWAARPEGRDVRPTQPFSPLAVNLGTMSVQDIARDRVVTANPDTPAEEVARELKEAQVGSVVVTEDGQPTGLVTDRDLVTRVVANLGAASGLTAGDIMTPDVVTIDADAGIFELTELMRRNGVRRVPVVNGGELDGIVTLDDVHRLLTTELSNLAQVIEKESPG